MFGSMSMTMAAANAGPTYEYVTLAGGLAGKYVNFPKYITIQGLPLIYGRYAGGQTGPGCGYEGWTPTGGCSNSTPQIFFYAPSAIWYYNPSGGSFLTAPAPTVINGVDGAAGFTVAGFTATPRIP